jgi:Protein of unknown function (DUF1253).
VKLKLYEQYCRYCFIHTLVVPNPGRRGVWTDLKECIFLILQNWDHLLHVLDHLHLQPREAHGTNFARVRSWALNGWSHYYRQTLLFSSVMLPELNALMSRKCHNYAGKICVINPEPTGTVCHVVVQLPQVRNCINLLAMDFLFQILAHPVFKM